MDLSLFSFNNICYADMAELADAPDLGSGVHDVGVQVPLSAVNAWKPDQIRIFRKGREFSCWCGDSFLRLTSMGMEYAQDMAKNSHYTLEGRIMR